MANMELPEFPDDLGMYEPEWGERMDRIRAIVGDIQADPEKLDQAKQGGLLDRRFW